ncbi:MAG: M24 family metallopeptidase [Dehalococcoidia bacterium]
MTDRLLNVRSELENEKLDGLLVTNASNRRYLSGFTGSAGTLLIGRDDAIIATDFRYHEQSAKEASSFRLYKTLGELDVWFRGLLDNRGGARLGFESGDVSYAAHRKMIEIIEAMPVAQRPQLVPTVKLVEKLRAIKDADEIALLQAAIDLGDSVITQTIQRIEPGWTERQIAWEIERYLHEQGAEGPSFSTIVAGGAWGAMPHAHPRARQVQAGESIVIDMGALVNGYCSDLTRTIWLGRPDDRFATIYDIVLAAQLTAYETIEPGMTGEQAHMLAQSVIDAAGYGENFGHGLGHGIGMQVHEAPRLSKTSKDKLTDGMVFSIEPGIYIEGWGGVRIEDLAILENGRCRFLSHARKIQFADPVGY